MTERTALILVIGMIGLAGMVNVPVIWLLARTLGTLSRVTGGQHRESDRERRDTHNMLMRFLETQQVNPTHAMQQHAMERMEQMAHETSLEREAIRRENPEPPPPAPPADPRTQDVTLALD
jgi:hypothetical protein